MWVANCCSFPIFNPSPSRPWLVAGAWAWSSAEDPDGSSHRGTSLRRQVLDVPAHPFPSEHLSPGFFLPTWVGHLLGFPSPWSGGTWTFQCDLCGWRRTHVCQGAAEAELKPVKGVSVAFWSWNLECVPMETMYKRSLGSTSSWFLFHHLPP